MFLARADVDPSKNDNEALRKASSSGHTEIVRMLLAHVDPSDKTKAYIIRHARMSGYKNIVRIIRAHIPRKHL